MSTIKMKEPDKSIETKSKLLSDNQDLKEEIAEIVDYQIAYEKSIEKNRVIEEQHRKSQLRFKTIFERAQLGKKILDSELSIIEVNDAFIAMLGYDSKNDIISRKILEFAHPDFVKHWHELQVKLWEEKIQTFSLDTCLVKKDHSVIWCHVTSILFEDEDKTLGYTIVEDINERKLLEEKAERLYQNQEMMMYMVAHDLKSPLNTIEVLGGFIKKNLEDNDLEKASQHLSMLNRTCASSKIIIDDLILIGELESEKIEQEIGDVTQILRSVIEQLGSVAKKKDISLIQELIDTNVFAPVNKIYIARVIENLLSNAIKFSNSGSTVESFVKQEGSMLILQIKDHGIGIPEAMQATVFNKFTKAKRKGTQGENTTGLGLFISKRIIDKHKGKIWFETEQNKGTTFFVEIPKEAYHPSDKG